MDGSRHNSYQSHMSRLPSSSYGGQPMRLAHRDHQGSVFQDSGNGSTVTITNAPPRTVSDATPIPGGFMRHTETRETLTPTISPPMTTGPIVREERMEPIVTTKAYETIRRDPYTMFPGAKIINVAQPDQIAIYSGVLNRQNNTFYSHINNSTTKVQPVYATTEPQTYNYPSTSRYSSSATSYYPQPMPQPYPAGITQYPQFPSMSSQVYATPSNLRPY